MSRSHHYPGDHTNDPREASTMRLSAAAALPRLLARHKLCNSRGAVLALVVGDWAMTPDEIVNHAAAISANIAPGARCALERATIVSELCKGVQS